MVHSNYRQELSRAKGRRNPSLFFALFCFFLPGRELRKIWCDFFGALKARKPAHKSRCKYACQCCCAAREGKESTGVPGRTRTSPGVPWQVMPEVMSRVPTHPQANTSNHSMGRFLFCELGMKMSWEPGEFGKFSILPVLSLQYNGFAANLWSTENTFVLT